MKAANEAYKFKNGKVVKAAYAIKPIVVEHTEYQPGLFQDSQRRATKVKVTVVAATQKMLYTTTGRGIRMSKAKLGGQIVTLEMLEFIKDKVKSTLIAERDKDKPQIKKPIRLDELRKHYMADEDPEIAQNARNMTDNQFYEYYKQNIRK